ncbi:MAG: hypothetical protein KGP10_09930 [Actinomycetales bacterium]|nr:hypothetical protein [Actinomycetales bacterium]
MLVAAVVAFGTACGGVSGAASTARTAAWVATNSDTVLVDIQTLNGHQSAIIEAQQAQDLPALAAAVSAAGSDATEMKQRYEASDMPEGDVRTAWLALLGAFVEAGDLANGLGQGDAAAGADLTELQNRFSDGWAGLGGVFGELLPEGTLNPAP